MNFMDSNFLPSIGKLTGMNGKSVVPNYTIPIYNNKYISGLDLQ